MEVTNAKYINAATTDKIVAINATVDGKEMLVPLDPANRHYQEIMALIEAGELTIEPADSEGS